MQHGDTSVVEEEGKDGRLRTIAGNFQCQMQLSQQRSLVITGYIFSDDSTDEINAKLDRFQDAVDRQFVRCDILNKEAQVAATLAEVEHHRDQLEALAAKTSAAGLSADKQRPKISSQERLALQNGQQTIENRLKYVEMLRAAIKEGRAKLGPVA